MWPLVVLALSLTVMASAHRELQLITPEELDILSFLRQNIAHKLTIEAHYQGHPKTHPRVVQATVRYFNLGPTAHQNFDRLVWAVAHGQWSVSGSQVTPQKARHTCLLVRGVWQFHCLDLPSPRNYRSFKASPYKCRNQISDGFLLVNRDWAQKGAVSFSEPFFVDSRDILRPNYFWPGPWKLWAAVSSSFLISQPKLTL